MTNLHDARVEAAAKAIRERSTWPSVHWPNVSGVNHLDTSNALAIAAIAAADAVVTVDGLQECIEDTLAYYQCRETNPKADHPSMGYHAFSEEQREWLRSKKSEAAAEIVRMILDLLRGGGEQ